jgi:outer membrane biosynthesis protein TonB
MYFDFEDYRPDTPSLTAPMTRREAVLLALLLHALLLIVYLITPAEWFRVARVVPAVPANEPQMTYTRVEPLRELPKMPKQPAPPSDLDRKSATVEKPPKPTEPDPFSKGNTPEKIEGAPVEKMKGPESPTPAVADPSRAVKPPPQPLVDNGFQSQITKPAGGSLGESLRNLQQFLKDQNFDNQKGGQTDTDAAIQFDSKGVDFGSWLRRFEQQVRRNWLIPQSAAVLSGHVVLTFYVHKNGAISDLKVLTPSTVASFTSSSFNALKASNPTIPLPSEYPDDKAFFTVTFLYNERIR